MAKYGGKSLRNNTLDDSVQPGCPRALPKVFEINLYCAAFEAMIDGVLLIMENYFKDFFMLS